MSRHAAFAALALVGLAVPAVAGGFQHDVIKTSSGDLDVTFVGHGSLVFTFGGKVVHVDPFSRVADYGTLPKANLILITHAHADHLDPAAIGEIRTPETVVVVSPVCSGKVEGAIVMRNGEEKTFLGIPIAAVPAYNIVNTRPDGTPYHPKGEGNGYVLAFGDTRVYVAGDTENTPEMKALANIAVAFLPMNLPYTMTPAMVADAARAFRPAVIYPYHYGDTDPQKVVALLAGEKGIEVRIRNMK